MSEINEKEIKSMTKEQNYIRGYSDGKKDVLDKIRAEIETVLEEPQYQHEGEDWMNGLITAEMIIDKYKAESEDES